MASGSPAVLKALSAIVSDQLNYFTVIVYEEESFYLCLGRFSVYFIKEDLSAASLCIKYQNLFRCLTDERKANLLQLQLDDERDP
jgi:hypothetical protein